MYIPTDRMVKVGDVNIRYWMEGEGTPVILIHGLSNSIEDWLLNFKALAEHHQVYALDLLGHGKTDKLYGPKIGSQLESPDESAF